MKKSVGISAAFIILGLAGLAALWWVSSSLPQRSSVMANIWSFLLGQSRGASCALPQNDEELRRLLSPEQYEVMKRNGTELPFQNAHWNNKKEGLYVDPISGEPLFSSTAKYDSGTGWPSFTAPIRKESLLEKTDTRFGVTRIEVRTKKSDSHLGHVFSDGPGPTGLRYCINSAALRFIPRENLEAEGYGEYLILFEKKSPQRTPATLPPKMETAFFGGGCFWGVEAVFQKVKGVLQTTVGYMGGSIQNPTYEQVSSDQTGYAETVQIDYDPSKISYNQLLYLFWDIHDPTTLNRQGPDHGTQYRSVVFYTSPSQEKAAHTVLAKLERSGKFKNPIVTEISPAKVFWKAEEYHQQYFKRRGIAPTCHLPSQFIAHEVSN